MQPQLKETFPYMSCGEPGANAPLRLCWLLPLTFQVMNARVSASRFPCDECVRAEAKYRSGLLCTWTY
ncbi:hypothetical protein LEMLEM_LOCUS11400 [Lemmus lemmus]